MNKISLDLYECNTSFLNNGLNSSIDIYNICSELEELNINLIYKPTVIPYFNGVNPKDDGVSAFCLFEQNQNLGFYTLHTFNKRKLAYFDLIYSNKINCNKVKNELCKNFNPHIIQYPKPLLQGSWGIEYTSICTVKENINFDMMYNLSQKIIKSINMTQITNTIIEENSNCLILLVLIAESHIGIIFDKNNYKLYLDIFSCKYYDSNILKEVLKEYNLIIDEKNINSRGLLHNNY